MGQAWGTGAGLEGAAGMRWEDGRVDPGQAHSWGPAGALGRPWGSQAGEATERGAGGGAAETWVDIAVFA